MSMTNEEIVRDYNQAANKSKQIKILADLNQVSPGEIKAVLAQAGVAGIKMPERIAKRKPEASASFPTSNTEAQSIYDRIEAILAALPEDSSNYVKAMARNLVSALFRESMEKRLGTEAQDET